MSQKNRKYDCVRKPIAENSARKDFFAMCATKRTVALKKVLQKILRQKIKICSRHKVAMRTKAIICLQDKVRQTSDCNFLVVIQVIFRPQRADEKDEAAEEENDQVAEVRGKKWLARLLDVT